MFSLRLKIASLVSLSVSLVFSSILTAAEVALTSVKDSGIYINDPGNDPPNSNSDNGSSNRGDGGRMDLNKFGDGFFVQFDFSSVSLGPSQSITSAVLELSAASNSNVSGAGLNIIGAALKDPWGEGIGNSGSSGDTGFPWGPASIGDASFNFKSATAVGLGSPGFAGQTIATAGTAWAGPNGAGRDAADQAGSGSLFDFNYIDTFAGSGNRFNDIPFSASGISVVTDMIDGSLDNNGFNIYVKDFTGNRADFAGHKVATRELSQAAFGNDSIAPTLRLTIVPEPSSLVLLGLGSLGIVGLRRHRS